MVDQRDFTDEYIGSFLLSRNAAEWEENVINATTLNIGLWDERLRLMTNFDLSRYSASEMDERVVMGHRINQNMELDVLRGDDLSLTVFGAYGEVDQNHHDFGLDDDDKKGPFSDPGKAATKYGGKIGLGPGSLTVESVTSWDADQSDSSVEQKYNAKVGLDLNDIRGRTGDLMGDVVWDILPDSVYVGYGFGAVDKGSGAATEDRTKDISAGANWDWGSGYSYLSYWSSYYDSRQPGSQDDDWAGDGLDLGGGLWGDRWNFDGSLSLSRSEQMGEWSESADLSLGGSLSLSYRPDEFPDLSLSLGSDHYQADYIASEGKSQSDSWKLTSELDFSKFWKEWLEPRQGSLKMVFQLKGNSSLEKWGGDAKQDSDTDFFVGFTTSIGLGE
jgi:hypothetical protein